MGGVKDGAVDMCANVRAGHWQGNTAIEWGYFVTFTCIFSAINQMLLLNSGSCTPLVLKFRARGTQGSLTEVLLPLIQNEKQLLSYFLSQRKAVLENAATYDLAGKPPVKSLDVRYDLYRITVCAVLTVILDKSTAATNHSSHLNKLNAGL